MGYVEPKQLPAEEGIEISAPYREEYHEGIRHIIEERKKTADRMREEYITPEKLRQDPEKYRQDLRNILGWPLTETFQGIPRVQVREEKEYLPGVTMRRLQIETLPGFPFYCLLFQQNTAGDHPLVIAQHGGGGTPELASDLLGENNYRHMILRLILAGCNVLAPQLLLWRAEKEDLPRIRGYGQANERGLFENLLRYTGGSIAALEIFSIQRALDAVLEIEGIRTKQIGMIGLSYGGFYTQMVSALETRIVSACSNGFFNNRYDYCWNDFAWKSAGMFMKDAEICALIAPRALCIHAGKADPVFRMEGAVRESERLREYYTAQNARENLLLLFSDAGHTLTENGEEMDFFLSHLKSCPV